MSLPLFPVTMVGSWPRRSELLKAQKAKRAGRITSSEFNKVADGEVARLLKLQEEIGVDIVTDGEQRRDNFYSFVAEKLEGVQLMSLGEMLDYVEDKAGFERLLQTLDVPSYAISNPTCVGKVKQREPLALNELRFVKEHTDKPVKIPLPGPYILTRAMWVPEVASKYYASKEELGEDVVEILSREVEALVKEGADFIQFDEPILTELVFTQGQTRTFMCAALASRKDPAEELEFAVSLINRVIKAAGNVRTGLHICRGNWSQDESTLLQGNYRPLLPSLEQMNVPQFVLEYATPRAGDLIAIPGKELGYGVVNPRTEDVESVEQIVSRVEEALKVIPKEKLFLNPDCGFATFSMRPVNEDEIAANKMRNIVAAAQNLRTKYA
ncbi:MAG: cobalamin-independent methionine synthase II family protein [Fimbriimonadaceae bacterium]|nr:cobalamin-independent methionine synthase II family protein [Fimbriimonadaceae bacterium]